MFFLKFSSFRRSKNVLKRIVSYKEESRVKTRLVVEVQNYM